MLLDVLAELARFRVILASSSPRRAELMRELLPSTVVELLPSTFAENLQKADYEPGAYAAATALLKGQEVWHRLHATPPSDFDGRPILIVSADTIVVSGHTDDHSSAILEKPVDAEDAVRMLTLLSGKEHVVHTGVAVLSTSSSESGSYKVRQVTASTRVEFAHLPAELIMAYVQTGEPMDKAGGYGIQGRAGAFVRGIQGEYGTVVGLPLHALSTLLRQVAMETRQE